MGECSRASQTFEFTKFGELVHLIERLYSHRFVSNHGPAPQTMAVVSSSVCEFASDDSGTRVPTSGLSLGVRVTRQRRNSLN
jgi:hypothetical protein